MRLRALEGEGKLACPVLALNEAATERAFNDRYGTGQSTLDGILRATNLLLAGRTVVVLGYGYTGRGIALRARGAGAWVIVCEVDPLRALEARMEGYEVLPALDAAERGDLFITVTGNRGVLRGEHFERMKDGAVIANAGHFDVEVDIARAPQRPRRARPRTCSRSSQRYELDGRTTQPARRRARGEPGCRAGPPGGGDGHLVRAPGARDRVARARGTTPSSRPSCRCRPEIDREVARLKLESLGVAIDELTAEQRRVSVQLVALIR